MSALVSATPAIIMLAGGLALGAAIVVPDAASAQQRPPVASGDVSALAEPRNLEGRIAEIFGDRFVLESSGGRILVEPSEPRSGPFAGRIDDRVTVTGSGAGAVLRARRIVRADGAVLLDERPVPIGPGSETAGAMPPQLAATLARLKLTPAGAALRKKHHTEITARMADGRTVFVAFDRAGRLLEIEDATYDKERGRNGRPQTRGELEAVARAAGFTPTGGFDEKKHHVEVEVRNEAGETLELHIDRAGYIYKQVWLW